MGDRHLLTLSIGVVVAALVPMHLGPLSLLVRAVLFAVVVVAWRREMPRLFIAVCVGFTMVHAGAVWSDAAPTDLGGSHVGSITLVADPESAQGGVRVRARVDGRTLDLRAWGSPAGWLRNRLTGERLEAEVDLRPLRDPPRWLVAQGVEGRGTITSVHAFGEGVVHTRIANSLRRTIESGASVLTRDERALYTGLVYGDDRDQSPLMSDDFDAAGLTHLVAVSGQNVAFVLAIVGPVLRRLGHRQRWVVIGLVLLVFATMTRFEPSVMRASAMAGVAATGALFGTAVPSTRVLTLAGTALLVWNPMLVHSVAFQLSVAASAGILAWSARLARAVPGPRPLVEGVAVTASAQLAVAPLLLWRFGGIPVAALPANVLAGPAAGPVMMWGMTAGWIAGLVPSRLADLIHVPTRLGLAWITGVARWSAGSGLGELGAVHIVALVAAGWWGLQQIATRRRVAAVAAIVIVLAMPWAQGRAGVAGPVVTENGSTVLRDADQTIVIPAGRPADVLGDLRRARIERIDLLVVAQSSFANADLIGWLGTRYDIAEIWAPAATMGKGEVVPEAGERRAVAGRSLVAVITDGRLGLALGD